MRIGLGPDQQYWCKSNQWVECHPLQQTMLSCWRTTFPSFPCRLGNHICSFPPLWGAPHLPLEVFWPSVQMGDKNGPYGHIKPLLLSLYSWVYLFVCLWRQKTKTKQTQIMKHNVLSYQGQTLNMIDREWEFLKNISHVYMMFLLVSWVWI